MKQPNLAFVLLLVCAGLARAQGGPPSPLTELESDTERNADPKGELQVIAAGQTLHGAFQRPKDVDLYWLELERPQVVSLRWASRGEPQKISGQLRIGKGKRIPSMTLTGAEIQALRYSLPKGRHLVRLACYRQPKVTPYAFSVELEALPAHAEREPNDRRQLATSATLGREQLGWHSHPGADSDWYRFQVPEEGILELALDLEPSQPKEGTPKEGAPAPPDAAIDVYRGTQKLYHYRVDLERSARFYPVCGAGELLVRVSAKGRVGDSYRLTVRPFDPTVPPELVQRARAAVDRGVEALIDLDPQPELRGNAAAVANSAATLLALAEGSGAKDRAEERAQAVRREIAWLQAKLEPAKVEWGGAPVQLLSGARMYGQAMATLALAEAKAAGYAEAEAPCRETLRFLLAGQLRTDRPRRWRPVPKESESLGGWRYGPTALDADLSVSGWGLIGLFAADAAGITLPELVPSAKRAIAFAKRCKARHGFSYQPGRGGETSVRQSVGALIYLLFAEEGPELKRALSHLDRHLCAGTQTGVGHDAPFYYWYYATRVHFLRGGRAWQAWRATALRQLVRRQAKDGSWDPIRDAKHGGRRYSTAFALLVLRLCLEEVPAYLAKELEAF